MIQERGLRFRFAAALAAAIAFGLGPWAGRAEPPRAAGTAAEEDDGGEDGGKEADGKDEGAGKDEGDGDGEEAGERKPVRVRARPSEREERVLALFQATRKWFDEGKIYLQYDLESRDENVLDDWTPSLAAAKPRIHWSTEGELDIVDDDTSTSSSSSSRRSRTTAHGLVVSDHGQWFHKAAFLPEVEVTFEVRNLAIHRAGTVLAAVFYDAKKKAAIGTHGGFQILALSGTALARPLFPAKTDKTIQRMYRHTFGYRLDGKVLEAMRNDKKVVDSSSLGKYVQGHETGHVGFHWAGSVQCFIYQVTIKGKLDPDWISEQLGEGKKAAAGKEPRPDAKGGSKAAKADAKR